MLAEVKVSDESDIFTIEKNEKSEKSADYDKAIAETGYGAFNVLLLLAALPVGFACVLDTTATAFIAQSAECDFELTLFRRGVAVGIVYIGMILASPVWDFLIQDYLVERLGKRKLLIIGSFLDSVCNVSLAHATSFNVFVLLRFFNGIIIAGPLSVLMSYLADFHGSAYQATFSKWANLLFALSNVFPPAVASVLILNASWFKFRLSFTHFSYFYTTWRVYLLICTIPSVLGVLTISLLPKSPKFILHQGKSHEALRLFKIMFCLNKFKSPSQFKVTKIISQKRIKSDVAKVCKVRLHASIISVKTLFSKPHSNVFLTIVIFQLASMLGFNTMRLWVPQVFVMLNNFRVLVQPYYPDDRVFTTCEMLFPRVRKINYASCNYTLPNVESPVYANASIITTSAVVFSFLLTVIASTRMKRVTILILSFFVSSIASFGINWAVKIPYMLTLCALVIVTSRTAGNIVTTYTTDVIPQTLKTTAMTLLNLVGNIGGAIGTIVFSLILEASCLTALFEIGSLALFCCVLSLFLIRRRTKGMEITNVSKFRELVL